MPKITHLESLPYSFFDTCAVRMLDEFNQETNKIYLFGGKQELGGSYQQMNQVFEYDINNDSYTYLSLQLLPRPMSFMCGVSYKNAIYLFGGIDSNNQQSNAIMKYDTTNGVTTLGSTTSTLIPRYAFLEGDKIYLTDKSQTYGIYDISNDTCTIITDTVNLSDINNSVINHYFFSVSHDNKIYQYDFDSNGINNLVHTYSISNYSFFEFMTPINDKELLFIARNSQSDTSMRYAYKLNIETQKTYYLPNVSDELKYQTSWGVSSSSNKVYMFGGWSYEDPASPIDTLYEINFNYASIFGGYPEDLVDFSNNTEIIPIGSSYTNEVTAVVQINESLIDIFIDELEDTYNNYIPSVQYDPRNNSYGWVISNVRGDLYISVTASRYYPIQYITNNGVEHSDITAWDEFNSESITLSTLSGYSLYSVKVYSKDGTDITDTVYDDTTHVITLNVASWENYKNILVKAFADTTDLTLTLYKNVSNSNVVDKNITEVLKVHGYLKDETSILSPSLIIDDSENPYVIMDANYVYIPNFRRYYFITSFSSVRTHLWRINLRVDVLMTYKNEILNTRCLVSRSASSYSPYIQDAEVVLESVPDIDTYEIENNVLKQETGLDCVLITTVS